MKIAAGYGLEQFADLMRKHQEEAVSMSRRLARVPEYSNRALRMSRCGIYTRGIYCPKCKIFHTTKSSLCRDRLCPNCGWALSRKRARAVLYAIDQLSEIQNIEVLHLVLTLKHDEETPLREQIKTLCKGIGVLMRYAAIRKYTVGYVRSIEIKVGSNGFHPHAHILVVMNQDYFKTFIPQQEWVDMWRKACKLDYNPIVWIKKAYSSKKEDNNICEAIYECVKYTIKTSDWKTLPDEQLLEAAEAIHGRQLFAVCGSSIYAPYHKRMEDREEVEEIVTPCKKCGTNRFIATINL
jgi:plasmid rolling circle replication initiator protein Rep